MTRTKTEHLLRHVAALLLCVLLAGCLGNAGRQDIADSGPKTLYFDANLGLSLTVSGRWKRTFIIPPPESTAPYAVRWDCAPNNGNIRVLIEAAAFPGRGRPDRERLMQLLRRQLPGFELTAFSESPNRGRPQWEILGHTGRSTFLVRYILSGSRLYQLGLFTRPEDFDAARSLFDEVTSSFSPLND
ncbi:hypothetical protein EDC39_10185 [Geothermobacter ehrlichii]|uniref:Lipoprotein n=1 Tax=Geothermobacter ehrlichii TaxID=213224 RepID=A0A5D3WLB4_9BACT|nr:hypothetical protein [Geothermobacter ehrlichii]TYO99925.1 hypothetical protein EDC39_10185 [Geothermobacter ehrlichii]